MSPSRLQKFKQVLVFNKCTLVQRIRDAIVSEKLGSQTIETDTTFSQIESPANGQDNPRVDDIYSFIEIKVKEVCRLEIENLSKRQAHHIQTKPLHLFGRKIIYLTLGFKSLNPATKV